jgi:hypothetical protein
VWKQWEQEREQEEREREQEEQEQELLTAVKNRLPRCEVER